MYDTVVVAARMSRAIAVDRKCLPKDKMNARRIAAYDRRAYLSYFGRRGWEIFKK